MMLNHTAFFQKLERELHFGQDCANHDWRQDRYKQWATIGARGRTWAVESWFKAEIALYLEKLKGSDISSWDTEKPIISGSKKKVDFFVQFDPGTPDLYLELKCLHSNGTNPQQKYYTRLGDVANDIMRYFPSGKLCLTSPFYCMLFLYPVPTQRQLEDLEQRLNDRLTKRKIPAKCNWRNPQLTERSALCIATVEIT